jgi:hypothetical protein
LASTVSSVLLTSKSVNRIRSSNSSAEFTGARLRREERLRARAFGKEHGRRRVLSQSVSRMRVPFLSEVEFGVDEGVVAVCRRETGLHSILNGDQRRSKEQFTAFVRRREN